LFTNLEAAVSTDLGLTCEARTDEKPSFAFLHLWLHFHNDEVGISPFLPNWQFSKQRALHPPFARCPLWLSSKTHPITSLRPYLLSRLVSFDYTYEGKIDDPTLVECLGAMLGEILVLQWPVHAVARICRTYCPRRITCFVFFTRFLGKQLEGSASDIEKAVINKLLCALLEEMCSNSRLDLLSARFGLERL
jgi:hypothetical protein